MPAVRILKIPIDDADFQRFVALYHKYNTSVEGDAARWDKVSRSISGSQRPLSELTRSVEGLGGSFTRVLGVAGDLGHGLDMALLTIEKIVKRTVEFSAAVTAAVDGLARGNVNARNLAASLNSSTGATRAFGIASRASGGLIPESLPAAIIAGAANFQTVGMADIELRKAGLTPNSAVANPIAASFDIARLAHNYFVAHRGDLARALAPQMAQMRSFESLGLTQSQILELGNTPLSRINQMQAFAERNAHNLRQARGSANAFQIFRERLGKAGQEVEVDLGNRIATVAPKLGRTIDDVAKRFLQLTDKALTTKNLDGIAAGLGSLDKLLESKSTTGALNTFTGEVGKASTALGALVKLLHPLEVLEHPAKSAQHALEHADAFIGHEVGRLRDWATGQPTAAQRAASDRARLHPSAMIGDIRTQARSHGVSFVTALATAAVESSLVPDAVNKHSSARGIFQQIAASRKAYGVHDWTNLAQAIRGGTTQLGDAKALARQLFPHASGMELANATYGIYHEGGKAFQRMISEERLLGGGGAGQWEHSWLTPGSLKQALGRFDTSQANLHALFAADPGASASVIRQVADEQARLTRAQIADVVHPVHATQAQAAAASGVRLTQTLVREHLRPKHQRIVITNSTASNVAVQAETVARGYGY